MEPWTVLNEEDYPVRAGKGPVTLIDNHSQSQCVANMVSLNLLILKTHVVKQDTFGYCYLEAIVDLALDEIICEARQGRHPGLPMDLIAIYSSIDAASKLSKKKKQPIKEYTRQYVKLWSQLFRYTAQTFSYQAAERIMLEAYNHKVAHKYQDKLKVVRGSN